MKLRHIDYQQLATIVPCDRYSVGYTAKALDLSRVTIHRMIKQGRLAGAEPDVSGSWLIPGAAILAAVPSAPQPAQKTETPSGRTRRANNAMARIRGAVKAR